MRIWCLHPRYLDARGVVALWREGLLARKVLEGLTKGYRQHPQLERFKSQPDPLAAINAYLQAVYEEASLRGYHFDLAKLGTSEFHSKIPVTDGQMHYELEHLRSKLKERDPQQYRKIMDVIEPEPHPLFSVIKGGIERWEKIPSSDSL